MQILKKKKKTQRVDPPTTPLNYPSGTIVKTDSDYFYIKKNYRLRFISDRAVKSWGLPIIEGTEKSLSKFPITGKVGFRDGTLVEDFATKKLYLISDAKKRHIVDPEALVKYGLNEHLFFQVSPSDLMVHEDGENLE